MQQYSGKSIFNGTAIGRIMLYTKNQNQVKHYEIEDIDAEIIRYEEAKKNAIKQLNALYEKALAEVGETNAMIFEVHIMMLEDEDYNDSIYNIIKNDGVNAEFAVATTGNNFAVMFSEMEDEYFKARAADVKDISNRVVNILMGTENAEDIGDESVIIVAEDLAPSETVQLDKSKLLAFVTHQGSSNSHTAILARTMNIPALIGIEIQEDWNKKMAIVDGKQGILIVDPDYSVLEKYMEIKKKEEEARTLLAELKGLPDVTKNGRNIKLYANIGSVADVTNVLANDAAGIGLFRSEFLYLEKEDYPTEEEQFSVYKTVVQNMAGKRVIIRTLDIGADKQVDYFNMEKEENPAYGLELLDQDRQFYLRVVTVSQTDFVQEFIETAVSSRIKSIFYPEVACLRENQTFAVNFLSNAIVDYYLRFLASHEPLDRADCRKKLRFLLAEVIHA